MKVKEIIQTKRLLKAQDDFEWLVKIRKLEKENERLNDLLDSLKNKIAKDQPFVEQCKAWCKYHASKRKERKEQDAYNRLLKIRELETENKRLNDLLEKKGEESYNDLVMICRLGIENGELEKEIFETFKVCERFTELVNIQAEEWARAYSRLDLKMLNGLLKEWAEANEKIQKKEEVKQ